MGDSITIHVEIAHLSELVTCDPVIPIDTCGTVQTPFLPIPVQNDISDNYHNDSVDNVDSDNGCNNQFKFLKDLKDLVRKLDIDHEAHFRNKVLDKLKMDMKGAPQNTVLQNVWLNSLVIYWTIIVLYADLLNN